MEDKTFTGEYSKEMKKELGEGAKEIGKPK